MDFLHPHRRTHRHHHAKREADIVAREPQRNHNQDVATVVSVVFVTAQNTFPSTVPVQWITPTLANGNPVQATATGDDDDDDGPTTTQKPKATSATSKAVTKATSQHTTLQTAVSGQSGEIIATSVKSTATHLVVAESSGSPTNTRSASAATSTANASASGTMSTGAKAGLALGVLILIGGVLALVLVAYKRKKDKKGERLADDEKAALHNSPPPPPAINTYAAAPVIREPSNATNRPDNAPRLSLRPVTQFSPNLEKNNANTTAPGGAATLSPNMARPASPWERKGAANAAMNSPASTSNPFGDHAETMDSPTMPSTPTMGPPANHDKRELPSLPTISLESEPLSAAPVATAAAIGVATSATGAPRAARPPPPVMIPTAAVDAPLPSPANSAWTDDVPSSPGPAPAAALPIAGGPPGPAGPNNVHRVQMDFAPSMEDELEIRAGQLVRMLHEYDDGWALCVRLDRSQQGVCPRTCLSKHPVKPRVGPPRGPPPPRGPMGPNGSPRPMTPNGRNSPGPGPFPSAPRPLTPNGRNSPGPFANQPRPMSPSGRPMSPAGRPMSPAGRPRANSNAPAYGRSMSPGPYGAPGQFPSPPTIKQRRRSNSASQVLARRNSPPGPSPLTQFGGGVPRKPVPGQAL